MVIAAGIVREQIKDAAATALCIVIRRADQQLWGWLTVQLKARVCVQLTIKMEATPGIEPGIAILQTAALPLGYVAPLWWEIDGAEEGIRTLDPRLGKAMLYH